MQKIILFFLFLFVSFVSFSQDQTNKGKDFWIPYPEHIDGTNSAMGIYITSDVASTGVITVGATTIPFTVVPNNVVYRFLGPNGGGSAPNTGVYLGGFQDNVVVGKGIHVTATSPVVVFAHIIRSARSGASLILPTKVWGKEYIVSSYANSGASQSFAELNVYASKPNTIIEITPTVATRNGLHPPGIPFQVTIPKVGDVYQLQFAQNADPSGTLVKSLASGTGCNPIAVFTATTWSGINCNNASGGDNFYQQLFPSSSWGKEFLTGPLKKIATNGVDNNVDIIRVFVKDPTTVVTKIENGVTTTLTGLTASNYYEYSTSKPSFLQADKPIQVIQYITSQTCGNPQTNSDPEMIALSAVEQTINDITVFSAHQSFVPPGQSQVTTHYINVIMKTANAALFRINGVLPNAIFTPIPGTIYSYLKEDVTIRAATNPVFRLNADSGFIAIAYGFGNVESYGYNAGTNVKDLYQQIGVNTEFGIEPTPSVCTNSPFRFKISLPYCADSIKWNLSSLPGPPATPPTSIYTTCVPGAGGPDSTTVVNGKTLYWYSLPNNYSFSIAGSFPVTFTTYFPNGECGNSQDIDFDLQVSGPPATSFTITPPGCYLEPASFFETTPQTPKATYKWYWDFGDGTISTAKNPQHTYAIPGCYNVKFSSITTPGCVSDTIAQSICTPNLPTASISGTNEVCQSSASPIITFTAANGIAPYQFTFNINGGAPQTVITTGTANTATVVVPTNTAGVFNYNLLSVKNFGSALCTQNQTGTAIVTINPLPTASIEGSSIVCLNDASPLITFRGLSGTAPYTFTYTINGGANQTATTIVGNSVNITVPTNIAGSFTYNLVSVKDASTTACSQNQNGSVTVVVKNLPTATIAGSVNVCLNAVSPDITFTGATGTAPYTFTYTINGGANQTITTTIGNVVTITAPTNAAGTFVYNLISVKEGSVNGCIQTQTGSATVVVNPLPTATISGTATVCLNAVLPNITFTGGGSTVPYTFTYTINGGANQTVTTTVGNTVSVPVATNVAGTFVYNLISITDASNTLCSQLQTGSATVIVNPLPTAAITGSTSVCLSSAAPNITFTGASGVAPYTFTYSINGGVNQTVTTTLGNSVTVAVPTNVIGTFTYTLLKVMGGSANACEQLQTGSAAITINPLPAATVSGTTAVCLNAASPLVTFSGTGSTAPYTFTYNINGGANQTITTNIGNTVTLAAPTNIAGTFTYNLVSIRDASSTLCSQAQTGNAVITVHPLPVPNFTNTAPSCETRDITFTDVSNPLAGTLANWAWNFGDPGSGANNISTATNPVHNFSAAGNYNISLTVTTSNGCSNATPFIKTVAINNRPLAGYIVPEVCLSDTYAQFTDTSKVNNGTVNKWDWNFGDPLATIPNPNTSALQNPAHSYTAVGVYNVQLIATNTVTGCKDTVTHPLQINGSFPLANFTVSNPTTLCANDSVAIVNSSTVFPGNITKVEIWWDNSVPPGSPPDIIDDFPISGKVYKHLYPNFQTPLTRIFNIRFRAYSGGVCLNEKISAVTVNAAPKVQFNNMPNSCLFSPPFQITQASEIGGIPGTFVFSGPGVSPTGFFNPATAGIGTHIIKYTFTAAAGGCVDAMSRPITVLDTATAKFSFINPTCQGGATTFKEESTVPNGVTLTNTIWNFGDGTPLENHTPGSTFTHNYQTWGPFTVTMYNTSAYGCNSTTKQQQVYISPIPDSKFVFGQNSVCFPNANVSFVNNSTIADGSENQFTYLWNFGDPASGALNTSLAKTPPAHRYTGTGPYAVRLTVTSGSQCVKDFILPVDFIHPQPKTVFDFNKQTACIGERVIMSDLTNGLDGTINQWFWSFSDGNTSNTQQVNYLFGTPKTYDVSLYTINSRGCNSDTLIKQFTVYPFPTVDAGPDRVVLEGGSITIEPIVTGNDLQFLWSPNTYLNNDKIEKPTASKILDDITYTLMVTGRGGCTAPPDKMFVKVLKAPKVPNTFTPNGDGINDLWKIEYLDTYPNNRVQVFTRTGQLVFESKGYKTPWDGRFNGKPLPFDTYYYIIEPENGRKPVTGYVTIIK
jgi:gliding motility-associated-like protein